MADEQTTPEQTPAKQGLPIKAIVVVMALLVLEGAAIVFLMGMLSKPTEVSAAQVLEDPAAEGEEPVELQVVREKFTNSKQGRLFIWDVWVEVEVKAKDEAAVSEVLERRKGLIQAGIARIVASAQHAYLVEEGHETIRGQIKSFLNDPEVMGTNPEGEPMIQRVIIPSCIGFPADY
jgi:flagellar basal body-associated protein FliL